LKSDDEFAIRVSFWSGRGTTIIGRVFCTSVWYLVICSLWRTAIFRWWQRGLNIILFPLGISTFFHINTDKTRNKCFVSAAVFWGAMKTPWYMKSDDEFAIVDIDIDDNMAYSLDQIPQRGSQSIEAIDDHVSRSLHSLICSLWRTAIFRWWQRGLNIILFPLGISTFFHKIFNILILFLLYFKN
jgi:hypothetical protein